MHEITSGFGFRSIPPDFVANAPTLGAKTRRRPPIYFYKRAPSFLRLARRASRNPKPEVISCTSLRLKTHFHLCRFALLLAAILLTLSACNDAKSTRLTAESPNTIDRSANDNTSQDPVFVETDSTAPAVERQPLQAGALLLTLESHYELPDLKTAIDTCKSRYQRPSLQSSTANNPYELFIDFAGLNVVSLKVFDLANSTGAARCEISTASLTAQGAIIVIPESCITQDAYYFLSATLDFQDEELPEVNIHGVMGAESIISGFASLSALSEFAYQRSEYLIRAQYDLTAILHMLADTTRSLLSTDIDNIDELIEEPTVDVSLQWEGLDQYDLFHWRSQNHTGALIYGANWYDTLYSRLINAESIADLMAYNDGFVSAPTSNLNGFFADANFAINFTSLNLEAYCLLDGASAAAVYAEPAPRLRKLIGTSEDAIYWIEYDEPSAPLFLAVLTLNAENGGNPDIKYYPLNQLAFSVDDITFGDAINNTLYFTLTENLLAVMNTTFDGSLWLYDLNASALNVAEQITNTESNLISAENFAVLLGNNRRSLTIYDSLEFGRNNLIAQLTLDYTAQSLVTNGEYLYVSSPDQMLRIYHYGIDSGFALVNTLNDVGDKILLSAGSSSSGSLPDETLVSTSADGIKSYSLTLPDQPELQNTYTSPIAIDPEWSWSTADRIFYPEAIFSLPYVKSYADDPTILANHTYQSSVQQITYDDNIVAATHTDGCLSLLDLNDAEQIDPLQFCNIPYSQLLVQDSTLLALNEGELRIYDISTLAEPSLNSTLVLASGTNKSWLLNEMLYIYFTDSNEVNQYDLSIPFSPVFVKTYALSADIEFSHFLDADLYALGDNLTWIYLTEDSATATQILESLVVSIDDTNDILELVSDDTTTSESALEGYVYIGEVAGQPANGLLMGDVLESNLYFDYNAAMDFAYGLNQSLVVVTDFLTGSSKEISTFIAAVEPDDGFFIRDYYFRSNGWEFFLNRERTQLTVIAAP